MAGVFVLLVYLGITLGADYLAPYGPREYDFIQFASEPTAQHFLGTDGLGRDMLTLLIFGSRVSIAVAVVVPFAVLCIGASIGIIAGFIGGRVDSFLMRFTDVSISLPSLLLTVVLVAMLGRGLWTVTLAFSLTAWPQLARVVRAETMRLRQMEYVIGARSVGATNFQIIRDHMLPNLVGPIAVTIAVLIPTVVIEEATLTYLNIGVELNGNPSWSQIIRNESQGIFSHPLAVLFPAIAISLLALSFTFVADGLRDALDPRIAERF